MFPYFKVLVLQGTFHSYQPPAKHKTICCVFRLVRNVFEHQQRFYPRYESLSTRVSPCVPGDGPDLLRNVKGEAAKSTFVIRVAATQA